MLQPGLLSRSAGESLSDVLARDFAVVVRSDGSQAVVGPYEFMEAMRRLAIAVRCAVFVAEYAGRLAAEAEQQKQQSDLFEAPPPIRRTA